MSAHNTVFLSYRRTNSPFHARLILQDLRAHGYDAYLDVNPLDSIALNQIAARAHFVVVLSKGSLEDCAHEGDDFAREIRAAIYLNRNIMPILDKDFNFEAEQHSLPPDLLDHFPYHKGLKISSDYVGLDGYLHVAIDGDDEFAVAMNHLREHGLQQTFEGQIIPAPAAESAAVTARIQQALMLDLADNTAESYLNRGVKRLQASESYGALLDFDEAIRLDPRLSHAYYQRGLVRFGNFDFDRALPDFDEALRLDPTFMLAYFQRGLTRYSKGELDGAISDFDHAIRLDRKHSRAYYYRGFARSHKGDLNGAIADLERYLYLDRGKGYSGRVETERFIRELEQKRQK